MVEKSSSIALATSPSKIILQAWTADGQPLDSKKLNQLDFFTLDDEPTSDIKEQIANHTAEVTRYYQGKIPYYDITNEANKIPWANELNFSTEQFLELTRIAANSSKKGYPKKQSFYRLNRLIRRWRSF